ncbi:MAG: deoxyguanosinetriphosphate triphosphohydrolase [Eubacteriales bacterium]
MSRICDMFLERETLTLSPHAFLTKNTRGREHPYTPCPNRTEFQRDRDRIIHAKAFRRLMHKTQVFFSPVEEHYRTRMTHTLEVSQIARIIARALRLNEDLAEAIALGHDIGHTPFGHAGEEAMRKCFDPNFSHFEQSLRVVDYLENDGEGLNLTYEVRDGILHHTGEHMASTLEGVIVKFADRIAYINHDIDDACRAGILSPADIPKPLLDTLGRGHSERINRMVSSVITASTDRDTIQMEPEIGQATMELRAYLYAHVYTNSSAKADDEKAKDMLVLIFNYFLKYPEQMPALFVRNIERDGLPRCVCDYVAGMTDRFAMDTYRDLFIPTGWRGCR